MIPRTTVIALAALVLVQPCAQGQRLRSAANSMVNAHSVPPAARLMEADLAARTIPRTYWLEGALIGAIGLGILTAVGFYGLCESSNCTGALVTGAVGGGAVGFIVGALVGGQFPKKESAPSSAP